MLTLLNACWNTTYVLGRDRKVHEELRQLDRLRRSVHFQRWVGIAQRALLGELCIQVEPATLGAGSQFLRKTYRQIQNHRPARARRRGAALRVDRIANL